MSYCVNCGVELSGGASECPLCNTPVMNPKELEKIKREMPFPASKGQVETVKRKDIGILLSVVIFTIAVTCGLLNALIFQTSLWSLAVIGACMLVWVLLLPLVIYTGTSVYTAILMDGLATALYLYLIARMVDSFNWFWKLGVPIVLLLTALAELFALCVCKLPKSFLTVALYCFTALGLFCVGLDLLIDNYLGKQLLVNWSSVVATVCVIFDIAIITLLCQHRLRNAVRKRLHF
ncbi:MAG: DUF6320 domain-containing protein [Roseburia sp.]|nr:DUF6320 domain-containing protein [Roseburia sp.]